MSGLLFQFLISLVASLLAGGLLYAWKESRWLSIIGASLVLVVVMAGTYWIKTLPPPHVEVQITEPAEGDAVAQRNRIRGNASPAGAQIYVVIHPMTTDQLWVQNIPVVQNDGTWQVDGYFGTETAGAGDSYEILALATDENLLMRRLRGAYLEPGDVLQEVPRHFARSNAIVVHRPE